MYLLYNLFGFIFLILSPLIIFIRIINGKEDPKRFQEKYSLYKKSGGTSVSRFINKSSLYFFDNNVTVDESTPPDKKVPIFASDIKLLSIDFSIFKFKLFWSGIIEFFDLAILKYSLISKLSFKKLYL